jgi:hypothetical protein
LIRVVLGQTRQRRQLYPAREKAEWPHRPKRRPALGADEFFVLGVLRIINQTDIKDDFPAPVPIQTIS